MNKVHILLEPPCTCRHPLI